MALQFPPKSRSEYIYIYSRCWCYRPWGTKAIRSVRNGATPVKSPAAGAWKTGLTAHMQDATVKAEETTASMPDPAVAQSGVLLSSADDAKPLDGEAIAPADHSVQETQAAEAGQPPSTEAASKPAVDEPGTEAATCAPEPAPTAGGLPRRKRTLSGRLLTSLDGSVMPPSESAPQGEFCRIPTSCYHPKTLNTLTFQ